MKFTALQLGNFVMLFLQSDKTKVNVRSLTTFRFMSSKSCEEAFRCEVARRGVKINEIV